MDNPWNPIIEEINLKVRKKDFQGILTIRYYLEKHLHLNKRNTDAWLYINDVIDFQKLGIRFEKKPWE
jgi:hypothetical protein